MNSTKPNLIKIGSLTIILTITFCIPQFLLAEPETPEKVYTGIGNAKEIIQNINFSDVVNQPAAYWAKDSIYETAALEAVKGYGDKNFRPNQNLSKEEAIALIYRMMGKEADSQKAAEALDAKRSSNQKKNNAVNMWADGYLQLASNDGLIKTADFQTAMQRFQPKSGTRNKFIRADPAQRQEVAFWVAKALKLEPVYSQQNIFNSFNDWSKAEPAKIPYIEAVLRNKIMNGKPGGYFDPLGRVPREQIAAILKNMEPFVLAARGYEKKSGYIENIYTDSDEKQSGGIAVTRFAVRGEDGKLYNILTQNSLDKANIKGQEFSPGSKTTDEKELVVYKNGKLSTGQVLKQNDRIDYIATPDNEVKFVNVRASEGAVKHVKGIVEGTDIAERTISIKDGNGTSIYRVSGNAEIFDEGNVIPFEDIKKDKAAVLTVENDVAAKIDIGLENPGQEQGGISGIVEENNPDLRYISLYEESGARSDDLLRIYNYKPETVEVLRNGNTASAQDIQPGDAVYLKRGPNNEISVISAADNYESAYGRIVSKQASSIGVEYDDGTQQVIDLDKNVIIILDKKLKTTADIHEGDYIRMLLQKSPEMTKIKEITLQTYAQDINSIYKGELANIDMLSMTIRLKHPEKFRKGDFERINQVGFLDLKVDDRIRIFDETTPVSLQDAGKLYTGKELYVAARKDFGGQEAVVMASLKDSEASEDLYDDTIFSAASGTDSIKLDSAKDSIKLNGSTIVIKDGRLTSGRSLAKNDQVYVVANRNSNSNTYQGKIILTVKKQEGTPVRIFRGKIGNIKSNKNFTLDSYSMLDNLTWEFTNSPKTFDISYDTRVFNDGGVDNVRDFVYLSEWTGTNVYTVADETEALLISNAPYGIFNAKGRVEFQSTGSESEEDGQSIMLTGASLYDSDNGKWEAASNITLKILSNTIIIKENEIVKAENIEEGDLVRVLKKEKTTSGDAYVIMVEK